MVGNTYVLLRRGPPVSTTCATQCPPKSQKTRQGASHFLEKVMTSQLKECPVSMRCKSSPGFSRFTWCWGKAQRGPPSAISQWESTHINQTWTRWPEKCSKESLTRDPQVFHFKDKISRMIKSAWCHSRWMPSLRVNMESEAYTDMPSDAVLSLLHLFKPATWGMTPTRHTSPCRAQKVNRKNKNYDNGRIEVCV